MAICRSPPNWGILDTVCILAKGSLSPCFTTQSWGWEPSQATHLHWNLILVAWALQSSVCCPNPLHVVHCMVCRYKGSNSMQSNANRSNQIWEYSRPVSGHTSVKWADIWGTSMKSAVGLDQNCQTCDIQNWALLCAVRVNQNWLLWHSLVSIAASDHGELHLQLTYSTISLCNT